MPYWILVRLTYTTYTTNMWKYKSDCDDWRKDAGTGLSQQDSTTTRYGASFSRGRDPPKTAFVGGFASTRPRGRGNYSARSRFSVPSAPFTLNQLRVLMGKDVNEIIINLMDSRFKATISSYIPSETLLVILDLLSQAFTTSLHQINQNKLMAMLLSVDFFNTRINRFISKEIQDNLQAFDYLADIFTAYSVKMPGVFINELDSNIRLCAIAVYIRKDLDQKVVQRFAGIERKLQEMEEDVKRVKTQQQKKKLDPSNLLEPPDNYRDIGIIPAIGELQTNQLPFLRENIVEGPYNDVDHYLDVQYRLLREDFVAPLRAGISEFIAGNNANKRHQDIRLYRGVRIIESTYNRSGVLYVLQFNVEYFRNINWKVSKRLIFGSLLCLSSDNFETALFASVAGRQIKDLEMGEIVVKFENDLGTQKILSKEELKAVYVTAESQAYFEAYRHVLKGLQSFSSENLPLQEYIVYGQGKSEPPAYLDQSTIYSLTTTAQDNEKCSSCLAKCHVMDINTWPSAEQLGLDESQKKAMHLALTSAVGVIQGPPGTGKTYIGLQIVQVLLRNTLAWKSRNESSAILVVCLTNHALDQFLEGMICFTDNLVRVGGQSGNTALEEYNLRHIQREFEYGTETSDVKTIIRDGYFDLNNLKYKLEDKKLSIKWLNAVILDEIILKEIINAEMNEYEYDVVLLNSLHSGFIDEFGVDPEQAWGSISLLAMWLGMTFNPDIVPDRVLDNFLRDEYLFQDLNLKKNQTFVALNPSKQVENKVKTEDLIEIDDQWTKVNRNRQLDAEETTDFHGGFSISRNSSHWSVVVEKLNHQSYLRGYIDEEEEQEFNKEIMAALYQMGTLRRMIAERELIARNFMDDEAVLKIKNVWHLKLGDRWRLYRRWIKIYKEIIEADIVELHKEYEEESRKLKEIITAEELLILKNYDIIGMTTTGAAKYLDGIRALKPKIVIVEEAAEVLESHIITALSSSTQHLILIGDHKQLRPNINVYSLARHYHLDVSLFERMIKNKIPYETLRLQHRMRPEISKLLVPHVYQSLEDHPSVFNYPRVKGMTSNVFFLNHNYPEREMEDMKTHVNVFEAEYLVSLANYFLQQGYDRSQITILTTYTGQLFELQKLMRKDIFQGVRVTVVDNFQGEENDIILLSFVRSNEDGTIGFLRIDNRVNVALSRAKRGLYCVGNFEFFAGKSGLWKSIVNYLKNNDLIGDSMPIKCENHGTLSKIRTNQDFRTFSPEGGCLKLCDNGFDCGHSCNRVCHFGDHKCEQLCGKILCDMQHTCPLPCGEECKPCKVPVLKKHLYCEHKELLLCSVDVVNLFCMESVVRELNCGHQVQLPCHIDPIEYDCLVDVSHELPLCKHQVEIKCSQDLSTIICKTKCIYALPCGHECPEQCHEAELYIFHDSIKCNEPCKKIICERGHTCTNLCSKPCSNCEVMVEKFLECGHVINHPCSKPVDAAVDKCMEFCNRVLRCNHLCQLQCYQICECCIEMVEKKLPCGHLVSGECGKSVYEIKCTKSCEKLLSCGHACTGLCGELCETTCNYTIDALAKCGHKVSTVCHLRDEPDLYKQCQRTCRAVLPCQHKCVGNCRECLQGRLHAQCIKTCNRKQICGHVCTFPCAFICPSCDNKCSVQCDHRKCDKTCGQPCKQCNSKCTWICPHYKCSKKCHEFCDRPRCNESCLNVMKCGHQCIGMCGEKCPRLCKICNAKGLEKMEDDARFIELDCEHCIEVNALDEWMDKDENEVKMKGCPQCNATIWKSKRYGNVIKQRVADVQKVKMLVHDKEKGMRKKIQDLLSVLEKNFSSARGSFNGKLANLEITNIDSALFYLKSRLKSKRPLYQNQLTVIQNQVKMLVMMNTFKQTFLKFLDGFVVENLVIPLMRNREKMNQFELKDVSKELIRTELEVLFSIAGDKTKFNDDPAVKECMRMIGDILGSLSVLSDDEEKQVLGYLKCPISFTLVDDIKLGECHWYKCSNGHVYENVGQENGDVNQPFDCPECLETAIVQV
uniref:NF-X1-type domain-containing protein n=1 Tax=Strigamia maritima TaxID=126957 RepID=T1J9V5_STRMM